MTAASNSTARKRLAESVAVERPCANPDEFCGICAARIEQARAEGWDEGAQAATADYGIGEVANPYRAALRDDA